MAEVLFAGFTSLTDLLNSIRVAVGDTSATNQKWSDDQVYLGIRNALARAGSNLFIRDSYALTLVLGTRDYTLPDYVQRVTKIERERRVPNIQVDSNTTLDYEEMTLWEQLWAPGNNVLHLIRNVPDGNATVYYERDVAIPLVDMTLSAAISSTSATSMTVTLPGTHNIWELQLPSYLQINNNEIVKATAVASPNTVTITRAQLGTTATTASSGDTVTPIIAGGDDRLTAYLIASTAAYLNMLLLQDAARGSDVAGNLTAMREFQQIASDLLKAKPYRPRPRRTRPERVRRRAP